MSDYDIDENIDSYQDAMRRQMQDERSVNEMLYDNGVSGNSATAVVDSFFSELHKQKPSSASSARAQRGGANAANGSSGGANAPSGPGSEPPEPQRNEPTDTVHDDDNDSEVSEADIEALKTDIMDTNVVTTPVEENTDETEQQEETIPPVDPDNPDSLDETDLDEIQDEPTSENLLAEKPNPKKVRSSTTRFTFDGDSISLKNVPRALVDAIRDALREAGAEDLAKDDGNWQKSLSNPSLLTALGISSLDLKLDGLDDGTIEAARVLHNRGGRVANIEREVLQLRALAKKDNKLLGQIVHKLITLEKNLFNIEAMLVWLITDRLNPRENTQQTPETVKIPSETVISTRSRIRRQLSDQRDNEKVKSGQGKLP